MVVGKDYLNSVPATPQEGLATFLLSRVVPGVPKRETQSQDGVDAHHCSRTTRQDFAAFLY